MKFVCGSLQAEVPKGWEDRSIAHVVMPPEAGLASPMLLQPQQAAPPVSLSFRQLAGEAASHMEELLEALPRDFQGFELLERAEPEPGILTAEARVVVNGVSLRQLLGAKVVREGIIASVGCSCAETHVDDARRVFLQALTTVSAAPN